MDEDFFLKKMKGVKPFKKENNIKKYIKPKTINKGINKTNSPEKKIEVNKKNNKEFNLSFGEVNRDLKRGKVKIDRRLDLHGYGLIEAQHIFKSEVKKNYNNNKRCLLVITGKGVHRKIEHNEDNPPKLFYGKIKNSIINWINEKDLKKYVLTYQDAGIEHGGDGAIFVYLRKNKT